MANYLYGVDGRKPAPFNPSINRRTPFGLENLRMEGAGEIRSHQAVPGSVWSGGQGLRYDSASPEGVQLGTANIFVGWARHNRITFPLARRVDLTVTMTGTGAHNIVDELNNDVHYKNLSLLQVRSAAGFGGSVYTITTDYTVDLTAGTITRVGGGGITDGAVVYLTFTYEMSGSLAADYLGHNLYSGTHNQSSAMDDAVDVIFGSGSFLTATYDTSSATAFAVNASLYLNASAMPTAVSGTHEVGVVRQLPTASEGWLSMRYNGISNGA